MDSEDELNSVVSSEDLGGDGESSVEDFGAGEYFHDCLGCRCGRMSMWG